MKAFLLCILALALSLGIHSQSVAVVTTSTADTLTLTSDTTTYTIPLTRGYQGLTMEVTLTPRTTTLAAANGMSIYYYLYACNNGTHYKLIQAVDSLKTTDSTSVGILHIDLTSADWAYYRLKLVNRSNPSTSKIFPRMWYYAKAYYIKPD